MIILTYAGPKACGLEYNLFTTKMSNEFGLTNRAAMQTFMFHCFVMMNLANMINCRVLDFVPREVSIEEMSVEEIKEVQEANKPQFNIFTRPFNNMWFWIIFLLELNIQFLMIGYPGLGKTLSTVPLTTGMHFTAMGLALGSWAIAAIMKVSGKKLLNSMPEFGEDQAALDAATQRSNVVKGSLTFDPADMDRRQKEEAQSDDERDD